MVLVNPNTRPSVLSGASSKSSRRADSRRGVIPTNLSVCVFVLVALTKMTPLIKSTSFHRSLNNSPRRHEVSSAAIMKGSKCFRRGLVSAAMSRVSSWWERTRSRLVSSAFEIIFAPSSNENERSNLRALRNSLLLAAVPAHD